MKTYEQFLNEERNERIDLIPHLKITYEGEIEKSNIIRSEQLWLDKEYNFIGPSSEFAENAPELLLSKRQKIVSIPKGDYGNLIRQKYSVN